MNKRILITGGTGFFGKNVLSLLLDHKDYANVFDEIVVLTRNSESFLQQYPRFRSERITYINGDIRSFASERTDFDYIMHLATDASKKLNDHYPAEMVDVILDGTKNILRFASRQTRLQKFLFASSGAVYGNIPATVNGVKEEDSYDLDFTDPLNAYALAKRMAELMCCIAKEKEALPLVIARGFAFVGEYLPQDTHFAIGNFIKDAKEKGKITIKSDGTARRSYMYATDLAHCLLNLLLVNTASYIFNVGSDEAYMLKEWAAIVAERAGGVEVEILNQPIIGYSAGANYIPNIDRLKRELNFNPDSVKNKLF